MNWDYVLHAMFLHAMFTLGFFFIRVDYTLAVIISLGPALLLHDTLYKVKPYINNTPQSQP